MDLLLNRPSEVLEHLNKIGEAFPDPNQSLLGLSAESEEENNDTDETCDTADGNTPVRRQRKLSTNLVERRRYGVSP